MNLDPLAETTTSWTPYNYVQNTPIQAIDPDGLSCKGCGPNGEDITPPTNGINGESLYIGSNASGNSGGGTEPKIKTEQLPEVVVNAPRGNSGGIQPYGIKLDWGTGIKDWQEKYGYGGTPAEDREQYYKEFGNSWQGLDPAKVWRIDATGFKRNWNLGMQAPGGTGMAEFWDGTFGGLLMGTMALPVVSVAGPGLGMQGLGSTVSEGATTLAARTYFNVVYRATPTIVNNLSYLTSRSVIGYSGQKILMTYGRQYVNFGRAVLQNPAALYTPSNFNFMNSRYTDFKRFKSLFD